jgi:hypothetical protein
MEQDGVRAALRELRHHIVYDPEGELTRAEFDAMLARADRELMAAGWREHDGRVFVLPGGRRGHAPCPVAPGTRIQVEFRDGERKTVTEPEQMRWGWTRHYGLTAADIIAWRPA